MSDPKFCKDCEHYKHEKLEPTVPPTPWMNLEYHMCTAERIDLVIGRVRRFTSCGAMRDKEGDCGPEGKLFKQREVAC